MLTLAEIQAHLVRLTYRPGWTFTVHEDPHEGLKLRIVARNVENSYSPGEHLDLGVESYLPPIPDTAYLEAWVAWRLARIENHECREWLKRDGVLISDPHATV